MTRLKYRFLQTVRDRGNMFWGLFYPIILASLFFLAFGHLGTESWTEIPVAYVAGQEESAFDSFVEQLDGELLAVRKMDAGEARQALTDDAVEGILYAPTEGGTPSLRVGKSGLRETVLAMVLDAYVKNSSMMEDIARSHPEQLPEAMQALESNASHIREVTLGGESYDNVLEYFFSCFAMLCFFGCFMGCKLGAENAANVTPLAARRSVSPERKSLAVLQDLLVGVSIQFVNALVFLAFLRFVLGISMNGNFLGMALISLLGSMTGVSLGIVVGSSAKLADGMKTLILVALPLFLCFLAGLMVGNMKYIIEAHIPLLNRVNPAALISDALFFLNVSNDAHALAIRLLLLLGFACAMTIWAFCSLRRTRYESI